jgi:type II secretory pathway pseudopilin PulG
MIARPGPDTGHRKPDTIVWRGLTGAGDLRRREGRCGGFALIAALIALVIVSMASIAAVGRASLQAKRERELQLLWIGNQYRQALQSYAATLPQGGSAQYPLKLEDLLEDKRLLITARYLRQLYADPFTGKADWVLELEAGRIVGLHSSDVDTPLQHANFGPGNASFANAKSHAGWHFRAADAVAVSTVAGATGSAGAAGATNPGSDADANAAPPPLDPNLAARLACYQQYMAPKSECTSPAPPMGNNLTTCLKAFTELYNACMASIGQ